MDDINRQTKTESSEIVGSDSMPNCHREILPSQGPNDGLSLSASADWLSYSSRIGLPSDTARESFPDFLVVSPARTGTTWIASNLIRDPRILIPTEKEVRYFDLLWRMQSVDWYCHRFVRSPEQLAGDVSPSYALLPSFAIKHIHSIRPDLKIVLLLRDLGERAWSHLLHTLAYGEANFDGRSVAPEDLTFDDQVRNLVHDYTLSASDYVGIIERWHAWFPKEQFHIDFFDNAISAPDKYFAGLLRFLGLEPDPSIKFSSAPVNRGPTTKLPDDLAEWIAALYAARRERLDRYLWKSFGLSPPWPRSTSELGVTRPIPLSKDHSFKIELRDGTFWAKKPWTILGLGPLDRWSARTLSADFVGDLCRTLDPTRFQHEAPLRHGGLTLEDLRLVHEISNLGPPVLLDSYRAINLVSYHGEMWGIPQSLGPFDLTNEQSRRHPQVVRRKSLDELKKAIDLSTESISWRQRISEKAGSIFRIRT